MKLTTFKTPELYLTIICAALLSPYVGGCDSGGGALSGAEGLENSAPSEGAVGGECEAMTCPFDFPSDQLGIVCVTPTPCSTDVSVGTDIVVEFNRPIVLERLAGDLLSETGDSAELRLELSSDGKTMTVRFEDDGLQDNLTYGLAIVDAVDEQENSLSNPDVFCFSTGPTLNCPELPTCESFDATDGKVPAFDEFDYSPPYADDSVWNTPIPENPAIAPESDQIIKRFKEVFESFGGMFMSVTEDAVPVYLADGQTPRASVSITEEGADSTVFEAPIPDHAIPDCGLDRFMSVLEQDEGMIYEFWRPKRREDASWEANLASASDVGGTGIFPARGPNTTDAVRASGFALTAGMIWPQELAAGRIEHALVFVYPVTREVEVTPPATATDGIISNDPESMPMGSLVQLDPSLDLSTLDLEPWEETIGRALQEYGMYLGDSGGGISLSGLHVLSFEGNPYEGLLPDSTLAETGVLLSGLPADRFRVLSPPAN